MRRFYWACLLCLPLLAGCIKTKPVNFGQDNRPLAMEMEKAIDKQDMTTIKKLREMGESRMTNKKISSSEIAVLRACHDYATAGKWDEAKTLVSESLRAK